MVITEVKKLIVDLRNWRAVEPVKDLNTAKTKVMKKGLKK
jgi:hypothetical protein